MDIVDCKCGERYWLNQQGWEASCDKCGRELKHSAIKVRQVPTSSLSSVGLEGPIIPEELFDGYAVYTGLSAKAKQRTTPENVSDVLDSIVALLKKI